MTKHWDASMRLLVRNSPHAFVDLVLPQASFVHERSQKLRTWQLEVDTLLDAVVDGQDVLLHIEFQTYHDATMAERLLRYNVLIRSELGLPVISYVIYLLKDGNRAGSPLLWSAPPDKEILQFHFESLEIGELTPEEILDRGQHGLLPLLPLTRGGANRTVVQKMFDALRAEEHEDLAFVGFTLASFVFQRQKSDDQEWLIRSFKAMYDLIRDTPIYQEMTRLAREEGLKEGLKEGLREGKQALRDTVLDIVRVRFPDLAELAAQHVNILSDTGLLRHLAVKLSLAQSIEEARQLLLLTNQRYEQ